MADNSEEEYLDSLLKNMMNENNDFLSENVRNDEDEDEDIAVLSKMLLADNNIMPEEEDSTDISETGENNGESEDVLSIDDLLNEAAASETEPEINPIFADNDFFSDLQEIVDSTTKSDTVVDEKEFMKSILESENQENSSSDSELSDLFALDEGMTIDDIPDENTGDKLTDEELNKISDISSKQPQDVVPEEVAEDKPHKSQKSKKAARPKKQKEPKEPKPPKPPKEPKPKFNFKEFFSKFSDEEDESKSSESDDNQKLIDELYGDKESLDKEDVQENSPKKSKKSKKTKPPKEKKKKPVKAPKEKNTGDKPPAERVSIGSGGAVIILLMVIVFLFGGFFGVKYLNYRLTINSAKNYYSMCNYSLAYEKLSGMDIKSGDQYFYEQLRTVMIVYQGYESYNNYIELGMEAEAVNALINAVGRKQLIEDKAAKYAVTDRVNVVYEQILSILSYYGIDESKALDLYRMTDYEEYNDIIKGFGGVTE
ncbi:MAG: hypothetical protein ACI4EN_10150 [Butyrivibrio sp.]